MHVGCSLSVHGSLEQRPRRPPVEPPARAATGGREARRGFGRERRIGLPELGQVPRGLFEVVAEDLVAARPGPGRASRASPRSVGAGRRGSLSGGRRRRRRGSGGGGSGSRPHRRTVGGRSGSARGARAPPAVASPASPPVSSAWTAPRWKTSPSTEPHSSTRRSAGSSWSSRAANSAFNEAAPRPRLPPPGSWRASR